MLEAIGKELKFIRLRMNLDVAKVANDLEINQETIRRYERNASGLSVEKLEKLLKYYNFDIENFFRNVCENMHEESND